MTMFNHENLQILLSVSIYLIFTESRVAFKVHLYHDMNSGITHY